MVGRMGAALLLLMLVAGCSSKGAAPDEDAVAGVEVKATATTGVIRGIVVDTALRPIAGATVRAAPSTQVTQTNDVGAFGLEGLTPGVHFLSISKPGFLTVQQSVDVAAGVDDPAPVRVQITPLPSAKPYHELTKFRGNQAFGVTLSLPPNPVGERPRFVSSIPLLFNGTFGFEYEYSPNPAWEQNIVAWEAKTPASLQLQVDHCVFLADADCDDEGTVYYNSTRGPSPLILTTDAKFTAAAASNGSLVDSLVVWASGTVGGVPDAGATMDQDFALITVRTYNYTPPAGYRFDVDGEPVDPR